MRRLTHALVAIVLLASAGSCRRAEKIKLEPTDESVPEISSAVHVSDPKSQAQLLRGFHELEQNAWRWTMRQFAVTLRTPDGAMQKGARLRLKFSIPEPVQQRVKAITLTASIAGQALPGETFSAAGDQEYAQDIPASMLQADAVTVDFTLDKFLPAGAMDGRELGVIATSISLETK